MADTVKSARDSGIWTATGGAKTADGIHPNAAGYDLQVNAGAINYNTRFVFP